MNHRLFVDTNIVIDLLVKREAFYNEAQRLFTQSDLGVVTLIISSLTFANAHCLLCKHLKADEARKYLMKFKVLVQVAPLDDKILELALASDFKDFEDAIQYYTAIENQADIIITRNLKDFKQSKLPVMTAKEYLDR
ncbi:MAG: PIN domain nuclease [Flavobacterium sp. BFFFF2]|nr:MAG: PIN domain nuclease [Flavobacterium sp. BFFFF2]